MKISEVVQALEAIKREKGDLVCEVPCLDTYGSDSHDIGHLDWDEVFDVFEKYGVARLKS